MKPFRPRSIIRGLLIAILLATFTFWLVRAISEAREAARATLCQCRLGQIGLALQNFESEHGSYPAAYTVDSTGMRLHGWRTLILRYFGEADALFQKFDLSVPWNHPNNAWASSLGPDQIYMYSSYHPCAARLTIFVAVVSPETLWPGIAGRRMSEITDDAATTISVLEIAEPNIEWSEPKDLMLEEILTTGLSSYHHGWVNAVFVDGTVRRIRTDVDRATLRALLTVNGGERIDPKSWEYRGTGNAR